MLEAKLYKATRIISLATEQLFKLENDYREEMGVELMADKDTYGECKFQEWIRDIDADVAI